MKDYFFECVNARGELAGTRVVLENLIKSLTEMKENDIFCEVSIELGRKRLIEIDTLLSRTIGEYVESEENPECLEEDDPDDGIQCYINGMPVTNLEFVNSYR